MTVDESSSQDATLIDDDLVAALGFEPVDSSNGHGADATRGGTDVVIPDIEAGDGELSDEAEVDSVTDLAVDEDLLVDEAVVDEDLLVDEAAVDEDLLVDEAAVDEDLLVDEAAVDDVDEAPVIESRGEDDAEDVIEDVASADLATEGATNDGSAGVPVGSGSFFDLDFDADDDPERDAAVDLPDDGEVDGSVVDVIDLDRLDAETVDGAEAPTVDDEDLEPFDLADSDSVFADVAVGDHTEHADDESTDRLLVAEALSPEGTIVGDSAVAGEVAEVAVAPTKRRVTAVKRRRRLRARKSRRVIRHIDPWSVLTFSVLFHMVVFASLLLSSVLVWNAAIASGMVENVESFIQELGDYETFEINADVMFRAAIVIAGMLTLASSVMVVLLTVVFNLISDLVGGIRVTVIEEETVRVPIDKKR